MSRCYIHRNWRFLVAVGLPLIILFLAWIPGYNDCILDKGITRGRQFQVLYTAVIMIGFYILCYPEMGVVGFIPLAVMPLIIVGLTKEYAEFYMKDNNMSFLATVMMGISVGSTQLQMRFVYLILSLTGVNLISLMLTVMWTTSILSIFLTSSAATVIMIPVAVLIKDEIILCLLDDNLACEGASFPRKVFFKRRFTNNSIAPEENLSKPMEPGEMDESQSQSAMNSAAEIKSEEPVEIKSDEANAMKSEVVATPNARVGVGAGKEDIENKTQDIKTVAVAALPLPPDYKTRHSIYVLEEFPKLYEQNKNELHPDDVKSLNKFEESLLLTISMAANIGGIFFPYSTLVSDYLYYAPVKSSGGFNIANYLTLRHWVVYSFPIFIISMGIISHLRILTTFSIQSHLSFTLWKCAPPKKGSKKVQPASGGVIIGNDPDINEKFKSIMRQKYKDLGSFRFREACVFIMLTTIAFLFFFRNPRFMDGWAYALLEKKEGAIRNSCIVLTFLVLMFIIPKSFRELYRPPTQDKKFVCEPLIQWKVVQKRVPWGIILMIGGSTCLFEAAEMARINDYVALGMSFAFKNVPPEITLAIVLAITSFLSQLFGNIAAVGIAVPILLKASCPLKVHPLYYTLPATISCILSFCLPISSIPNAILFHQMSKKISFKRMFKVGLLSNAISLLVIYILHITYAEQIFHFKDFPGLPGSQCTLAKSFPYGHKCVLKDFKNGTLAYTKDTFYYN